MSAYSRAAALLESRVIMRYKYPISSSIFHPNSGHTEIIIEGIPKNMFQLDVLEYFRTRGNIVATNFPLLPCGEPAGILFILYETEEAANRAIKRYDLTEIAAGHVIRVGRSETRIFLQGVPSSFTLMDIWKDLNSNGIPGINNIEYSHEKNLVFINFRSHFDACNALRQTEHVNILGMNKVGDWARLQRIEDPNFAPNTKCVHLANLSRSSDWQHVATEISRVVEYRYIDRLYKKNTYAILELKSRFDAEQAYMALTEFYKHCPVRVSYFNRINRNY